MNHSITTENSGTINAIAAGAGGTVAAATARRQLATWSEPGYARNLVVRIGWTGRADGMIIDPTYETYGMRPASVYSPAASSTYPGRALFLEIECGAGAQRNVFACDIAQGSIALPPCEFARVSLVCFGASELIDHPLTAAIVEGFAPNAPPPTFTQMFLQSAGSWSASYPTPPCARAVDAWAMFIGGDNFALQATAKIELTVAGGSNYASPLVRRDYANSSFLPVAGPVDWAQWGNDKFTLAYTQTSAFASQTAVRWYIAP